MNLRNYLQNKQTALFLMLTFFSAAYTKAAEPNEPSSEPSFINSHKSSLGLGIIGATALTYQAFKIYKEEALNNNLPWSYKNFIKKYPKFMWQALTTKNTDHPYFSAAVKLFPLALTGTLVFENYQTESKKPDAQGGPGDIPASKPLEHIANLTPHPTSPAGTLPRTTNAASPVKTHVRQRPITSITAISTTAEYFTDRELQITAMNSPELQSLGLEGCHKITDAGVRALTALDDTDIPLLRNLQSLNLKSCRQITDAGIQHVSKLINLQSLNLGSCNQITDTGIGALARLTKLQNLDFWSCRQITDAGIQALTQLTNLQSLNLWGCRQITDAGIQHVSQLINLQSLNLGYCSQITDTGVLALAALPNLQNLDLTRCDKITNAGLVVLAQLTNLQSLSLRGCRQITPEAINALQQALPGCEIQRP